MMKITPPNPSPSTSPRSKADKQKQVIFFIVWLIRLIVDAIREKKAHKQQEKSDPA